MAMAAMASFGESTSSMNATAKICSVKGTGPIGTVNQADTAVTATVSATNTIDRVRDPVAVFFCTCSIASPFDLQGLAE